MFDETFIDSSTGTANCTAEHMGQILQEGKIFFGFHAAAAGADERSIIDGHFTFGDDRISSQDFNAVFNLMFQGIFNNFTFMGRISFRSLEGLWTAGTHLRTVFFAEDRGHDVTASSRTGPFNKSVFFDVQNGAVCAQTGTFTGSHARTKVTAIIRSADKDGVRTIFSNQFCESVGVKFRGIMSKLWITDNVNNVSAMSDQVLRDVFRIINQEDSPNTLMAFIGHFSNFAEQFVYDMNGFTFVMFAINP